MTKKPLGTFLDDRKEPVISRVFQLVDRYSSRSEAARAWGMNINTLQNYYKRKDINPVPRKAQLLKIAKQENVSLEWLLTGEGDNLLQEQEKNKKNNTYHQTDDSEGLWLEIYRSLTRDKREKLLHQVKMEGINSLFKDSRQTQEPVIPAQIPRTTLKTVELFLSLSEEDQREILQGIFDKESGSVLNMLEDNAINNKKTA
jgi:hypothetical protein